MIATTQLTRPHPIHPTRAARPRGGISRARSFPRLDPRSLRRALGRLGRAVAVGVVAAAVALLLGAVLFVISSPTTTIRAVAMSLVLGAPVTGALGFLAAMLLRRAPRRGMRVVPAAPLRPPRLIVASSGRLGDQLAVAAAARGRHVRALRRAAAY